MSELTTEKAIGIIADDLCFETGGIDEPHTNGCAQEAVAKAWLAQVKREAKVQAHREAADAALAVREDHCGAWPWPGSPDWFEVAEEYEATKAAYEQLKESPWGWIMDRADRMEAKK